MMATAQLIRMVGRLRSSSVPRDGGCRTDGELLAAVISHSDDLAFECLVKRHGPMVLGVCRRILGNLHDAEDAFQATFLVLMRKAGVVTPREGLANWLYGVAYRTSREA